MTKRRTVETPIPAELLAAPARPGRTPEPETNLSLMALAYIRDRQDVAAARLQGLAQTQKLTAAAS